MHSPFCHYVNLPNPTPNLASWRNLTAPPPPILTPPPPDQTPKMTRAECPVQRCAHCKARIKFHEKMTVKQYQSRLFCSSRCWRLSRRSKLRLNDIRRIYLLRKKGLLHKAIAAHVNVAVSTVSRVLRGVGPYRFMADELGLQPEIYSPSKKNHTHNSRQSPPDSSNNPQNA